MVRSTLAFPRLVLLVLCSQLVHSLRIQSHGVETCAKLTNKGSHSTVQVSIGTPPQKFNLVADTGSDALIVESCVCVDQGKCDKASPCFRGGANRSSSFHIDDKPAAMEITFGSGPVETVIATDIAKVGNIGVEMKDSVLLMVDQRLEGNLDIEGILGLGLPSSDKAPSEAKGFLDVAHVARFSMCFNVDGEDGVLRLGDSVEMDKPLGSVGRAHWGLDFRGISVGDKAVAICDEALKEGQETPCGAMVDSGTTLIMAPADQLAKLFEQLCDAWSKCPKPPASLSIQRQVVAKAKNFLIATSKCDDLHSLPSLRFHVRGADGTSQTLMLNPDDYMIETQAQRTKVVRKWYMGVIPVNVTVPVDGLEKVCIPAFHTMDFDTQVNGPVWIFGTPFFYKYVVSYDRVSTPPSISFSADKCTQCGSSSRGESLVARQSSTRRTLNSDPHIPYINLGRPF